MDKEKKINAIKKIKAELERMDKNENKVFFFVLDTKIATQAHSFRCGLMAQQYKLFNKLNYIFNFTMEIFTYAI